MRFLLLLFLMGFFAYALGLVVLNNSETAVNLVFLQAPAMNLGLLLIVSIMLGLFIGILVSILLFRVLQKHLELNRLKKENDSLKSKLDSMTTDMNKLAIDKNMLESMMSSEKSNFDDDSINND